VGLDSPLRVNDGSHQAPDFLKGSIVEFVVGFGGPGGVHVVNILNMGGQVKRGLSLEQVNDVLLRTKLKSQACCSWVIEANLVQGIVLSDFFIKGWKQGVKLVELNVTTGCGVLNCHLADAADEVLFSKELVDLVRAGVSKECRSEE